MPTAVPIGDVLVYGIGRGVSVADGADIELVGIGDSDGEALRVRRAIRRGGPNGDGLRRIGRSRSIAAAVRTKPSLLDREAAAGIVVERVGDGVGGGIGIGRGRL